MSNINYPYLPEGKEIKYVEKDNFYIQKAREIALQFTGCSWLPTASVVVKDGKIIGSATNRGEFHSPCPRRVANFPTGQGYHLCHDVCKQLGEYGHSEYQAVVDALEKGQDTNGADLYLYGHWWCCEPCWKKMLDNGIKNVYLLKNSEIIFGTQHRESVQKIIDDKKIQSISEIINLIEKY